MTENAMITDPPGAVCNCLALRQAARRVTQLYDRALAPVGIGVNQFSILSRLLHLGPTSIRELAAQLTMDRSTLGHLARPLEARGLVTLAVAERDRRSRSIALTDQGRALLGAAKVHWQKAQQDFEQAFGARRAAELRSALKQIAALRLGAGD